MIQIMHKVIDIKANASRKQSSENLRGERPASKVGLARRRVLHHFPTGYGLRNTRTQEGGGERGVGSLRHVVYINPCSMTVQYASLGSFFICLLQSQAS
jgi:hypothetical protein